MPKKLLDEQRVIDYLSRLMSGSYFSIEDLDAITVGDLLADTPIADVDREIVKKTLDFYKRKYRSEIFKEPEE